MSAKNAIFLTPPTQFLYWRNLGMVPQDYWRTLVGISLEIGVSYQQSAYLCFTVLMSISVVEFQAQENKISQLDWLEIKRFIGKFPIFWNAIIFCKHNFTNKSFMKKFYLLKIGLIFVSSSLFHLKKISKFPFNPFIPMQKSTKLCFPKFGTSQPVLPFWPFTHALFPIAHPVLGGTKIY